MIPAFNEENSIGKVLGDIPKTLVREVVVVDNNSSDQTAQQAKLGGATVLPETRQGYGAACLCGINYLKAKKDPPEILVFIDADYSDYPEEMTQLVAPIWEQDAHLVIGSRALGNREQGSMTPQQVFGNWLATSMLRWFYGVQFTDLGPFRAIRWQSLMDINMVDTTYGWTVEMQVKVAKRKLKSVEIPVKYRRRIGVSKIAGTVKGTILAGYKIIFTIFKYL
ncbi:MAG: glycosyltransferase family 2 protein [Salibacteraceae bacterium]